MSNTHQGGIRPPDYLREMALSRIEDLMVQAMPWKRIVAILVDEGITESEETAKNWRQEVQRRWAAEDSETRPAMRSLWNARLEAQYKAVQERAAVSKSDFAYSQLQAEATRIAKVAIVLNGLHQPSAARPDGMIDPIALSPVERERQIADLLAKREAARAALASNGKVN